MNGCLRRLSERFPDRGLVLATTLADPFTRLIAARALDGFDAVLWLLCPCPLSDPLGAQPDPAARRDLLRLVARAERRIGLPGTAGLADWLARRPQVLILPGEASAPASPARQVRLDPAGERTDLGIRVLKAASAAPPAPPIRQSWRLRTLHRRDLSGSMALPTPDAVEDPMLITFRTKAYADITMFGDVALNLIHLMGHSGSVPGAILAEDVPAALARLRAGAAANPDAPAPGPGQDDDTDEPPVTLSHRALPLIELLEAAARDGCNVMWDRD